MTLWEPAATTVLTGAAGWFGRAFLNAIAGPDVRHGPVGRRGAVRALVRTATEVPLVLAVLPRAEVFVGDVADPVVAERLLRSAPGASVVHAAGVIHPDRVADFERVNVGGTRNLLEAARDAGARRLVHVSSISAFGVNPTPEDRFRHDEPFAPYLGYGHSKMRAEQLVRAAHDDSGLHTVVVRPPWFYGPWQPARQTTFFGMVAAGYFPLMSGGNQRRSMVYIDNLVQGVALVERHPGAAGGAFWLADERPYPMSEIVDTIKQVMREEGYRVSSRQRRVPAVLGRAAESMDRRLQRHGRYQQQLHVLGELDKTIACDVGHSMDVLGYRPEGSLHDGMRRSVRWCRSVGIELAPRGSAR